jgi:hypothetical protein
MLKKIIMATLILTLILTAIPTLAADNQNNIAIIGSTWDMPPSVVPTIDISNSVDLVAGIEKASSLYDNGTNIIVVGVAGETGSNLLYSTLAQTPGGKYSKNPASLIRVGGKDRNETQQFLSSYLKDAKFYYGADKHCYYHGPTVVGALYDMPKNVESGCIIDTTDIQELKSNIEQVAQFLAKGSDIVVAGGPGGSVSDASYQEIIDRANELDPNHCGSIVRIGGEEREQTVRFMESYMWDKIYPSCGN